MVPARPTVAVIGAGVGALACAIDAAATGAKVVVFDRAAGAGGKMTVADVGGTSVDAGPTVLTMRWVFDELFAAVGRRFEDEVGLEACAILARHAWSDGTRLDLYADRERTFQAIREVFGEPEARAYAGYLEDGHRIFEAVLQPFLRSQRPTITSLMSRSGLMQLGALRRIDAFRTMWTALEKRFESPRLRQLFGRYATYCGSSPFEAPATLGLVPWVEAAGVCRVVGGMGALRDGLLRVARSMGVEFRFDAHVDEILVRRGRADGVRIGDESVGADAVVFNGDVAALGAGLLGRAGARAAEATPRASRSLSAVTIAAVGTARGFPLVHHNVFFSDDYPREFEELFGQGRAPSSPTVYLCAQNRGDQPLDAAEDAVLIVGNAPATGDRAEDWTRAERLRCEESMFRTMERCGLVFEPRASSITTPVELEQRFPATGGALYGPVSRGPFSALSRGGARSKIPGLYLAGGSVHPGPGVPMAALSGRLAAAQLAKDLGSTSSYSKPAMPNIPSSA